MAYVSRFGSSIMGTLSLVCVTLQSGRVAGASSLTFEKDIRPILKAQCFHCHGEDNETKGGLDVRLARLIIKGGDSGPAIVPGDAAQSHLLDLLKKGEMPKGKAKLKDTQLAAIEEWIRQGARTARPEPEKLGPEHAFTDEERAWWALQPIRRTAVPDLGASAFPERAINEIDFFVAARLKEHQLSPSPEADPVTLIRRATFDLTGLPPTPEEVEAFVNDRSPRAYESLIDRLLASQSYGERWGRHWLDVAGYADSDGFTDKDLERQWAYKYRDYVIRALNEDKPFDQFIREQLAGDEMVPQPYRNLDADAIEKLTATGFLRMAPDGTGAMNLLSSQNAAIADTLKVLGTALYGMTIGCAQCHDHRYDPISQEDYYRLRAIFEPGFDTKSWRVPAGRLVSLLTDQQRAEGAKFEEEAKKIDAARLVKQEQYITEVLEKELEKREATIRDALRTAYRTEVRKRTAQQIQLLNKHPTINQLSAGSLYLYDTTYKTRHADELKRMAEEAAAIRAKKPAEEFLHAFTEVPRSAPAAVPATFLFNRGEPTQPRQQVKPGDLSVLAGIRQVEFPEKSPAMQTTGRRLAFANALTDGKHPMLARVMVNRVWMHHFGKGIVASPGDFGQLGQRPSHPELLDWLASEFIAQGWSLKKLHKLIMLSATYRQRSTRDAGREQIDPDNRLLSRMNVRRLEAEGLRDAMLAVSGKLNGREGGRPVPVMFNEEGQVVLGVDTTDSAGRPSGKYVPLNGDEFRRSIYVQMRRSRPLEMFATFDAPIMEPNCDARPVTTVSPQSLLLMNNGYMREFAQYLAGRLQKERPGDLPAQVHRAWALCYGRAPSMADELAAVEFASAQTEHYKAHPAKLEFAVAPASKENAPADLLGLAALCHALLSSNEFLYVD